MQIFLFVWFVNFGISLLGAYFKNLALKLRIYNFRGVCVCNCPPHLPSPSPQSFPPILLLSYLSHYSSGTWSVCDFVCFLLFASIPIVVDHLLYLFLYSIYYLSLYGSYISIVFKNGSMSLQRTIYDPFLRAILIPKCTYFHL